MKRHAIVILVLSVVCAHGRGLCQEPVGRISTEKVAARNRAAIRDALEATAASTFHNLHFAFSGDRQRVWLIGLTRPDRDNLASVPLLESGLYELHLQARALREVVSAEGLGEFLRSSPTGTTPNIATWKDSARAISVDRAGTRAVVEIDRYKYLSGGRIHDPQGPTHTSLS